MGDVIYLDADIKEEEIKEQEEVKEQEEIKENDYSKLSHNNGLMIFDNKRTDIINFKVGTETTCFSQGFYKTCDKKCIKVSFEAISIGKDLSKVYLSIDCFTHPSTDPKYHIPCHRGGLMLNEGFTLKEIKTDAVFSLNVDYDSKNYEIFKNYSNKIASIVIAIFFDGDTNKLPDHLTFYDGKKALYSLNNDTISLNEDFIPVEIINKMIISKTIFRLHHGSGYVYPLGWFLVPNTWTTYSALLSPVGNYSTDDKCLRMGTRYIKVGLLANYQQTVETGAEFLIKNFTVSDLE